MRKLVSILLLLLLSAALELPSVVRAGPFDNSLWVGTDNTPNRAVLNIDRAGNELRSVDGTEATGIAIDPQTNLIYFGVAENGQVTGRNLVDPATIVVTLNPPVIFGEDMAFDGAFLWRADIDAGLVQKIDPNDGSVVSSFSPGFSPLGVAWDGTNLWVSDYAAGSGLVTQFTTDGVATGNQFNTSLAQVGGLAFDTTDNTLWIGTYDQIYHFTTAGTMLGSIDVPGRFIDGLEFEGVQDPAGVLAGLPVSAPAHIQVAPNPFSSRTSVRFTLAGAQQVDAAIYDLEGRLVRSLKTGRLEAGSHEFDWDGRDARGNPSGIGVYLVRIHTLGGDLVAKVARLQQ